MLLKDKVHSKPAALGMKIVASFQFSFTSIIHIKKINKKMKTTISILIKPGQSHNPRPQVIKIAAKYIEFRMKFKKVLGSMHKILQFS